MARFFLIGFLLFSSVAWSDSPTSFKMAHPIGWMHQLPVGETPGWDTPFWFSFEVNHSNVWNAPIDLLNTQNNETLYYTADFEQTSGIIEFGMALNSWMSFAMEIPYALRGGGGLDQFIDGFHIIIGSDRFNRHQFEKHQNNFDIQTDGVSQFSQRSATGFSNIKYKFKQWWWQTKGNRSCACGFSTSIQVKQPVGDAASGLTTGKWDYSLGWHLGFTYGQESATWISSAATHTAENPFLDKWPRRRWHQMYEIANDWAISKTWGILFTVRMESPILQKEHLNIINTGDDTEAALAARIASGWNSLVHWRGSQGFGARYRPSDNQQLNMILTEDWAFGDFDERGDEVYTNNAPDVSFLLQYHVGF